MSETPSHYPSPLALIAIDPGLSGAIALLNGELTAQPLPISGKELDLGELARLIQKAHPVLAVVEKVHSMPGQGVSSTFKFGTGYGSILGILAALSIRTELIPPQTWKKVVLQGTDKSKDAAIAYCRRSFPSVPLVMPRCRKPHDGIADALCLLEYARRCLA